MKGFTPGTRALTFAVALLSTLTVASQALAQDYDDEDPDIESSSLYGGIGGGVDVTGSSEGGSSASIQATGRVVGIADGRDDEDDHFFAAVDARIHYNAIGFGPDGATTGIKGDGQLALGYTPADSDKERGCDIYAAASGTASAGAHRNLSGSDVLLGYVGLETGPICYLNNAVLTLTPTVQAGAERNPEGLGEHTHENFVLVGGRIRAAVHDKFYFNGEVLTTVPGSDESESTRTLLRASTDLRLGEDWWLSAYVRGIHEENDEGVFWQRVELEDGSSADTRTGANSLTSGEAGLSVIRGF